MCINVYFWYLIFNLVWIPAFTQYLISCSFWEEIIFGQKEKFQLCVLTSANKGQKKNCGFWQGCAARIWSIGFGSLAPTRFPLMDKLNKKIATKTVKKQGCKKSHSKATSGLKIRYEPNFVNQNLKTSFRTFFHQWERIWRGPVNLLVHIWIWEISDYLFLANIVTKNLRSALEIIEPRYPYVFHKTEYPHDSLLHCLKHVSPSWLAKSKRK